MKFCENTPTVEETHPLAKLSDGIMAIREEAWGLREHLLEISNQFRSDLNFESLPKRLAGDELDRAKRIVLETQLKEIIPIVHQIRDTLEKWYDDDLPSLYKAGSEAYHSTQPSE